MWRGISGRFGKDDDCDDDKKGGFFGKSDRDHDDGGKHGGHSGWQAGGTRPGRDHDDRDNDRDHHNHHGQDDDDGSCDNHNGTGGGTNPNPGNGFPEIPADTYGITFHVDLDGDAAANEYYYTQPEGGVDPATMDFADYYASVKTYLAETYPDADPSKAVIKATIYSTTQGESYYYFTGDEQPIDPPADTCDDDEDDHSHDHGHDHGNHHGGKDRDDHKGRDHADNDHGKGRGGKDRDDDKDDRDHKGHDQDDDENDGSCDVKGGKDANHHDDGKDDAKFYFDFAKAFGEVKDDCKPEEDDEDEDGGKHHFFDFC